MNIEFNKYKSKILNWKHLLVGFKSLLVGWIPSLLVYIFLFHSFTCRLYIFACRLKTFACRLEALVSNPSVFAYRLDAFVFRLETFAGRWSVLLGCVHWQVCWRLFFVYLVALLCGLDARSLLEGWRPWSVDVTFLLLWCRHLLSQHCYTCVDVQLWNNLIISFIYYTCRLFKFQHMTKTK